MQRYWFKPKRYGLGAAPSYRQGWALALAYCLAVTALGIWFGSEAAIINERLTPFAIIVVALTIIFVGVVWRTTDGGFHWRWDGKD